MTSMAQHASREDDVQAWIDGRLGPDRAEPLRAWFEEHPETAARAERDRELDRQRAQQVNEPVFRFGGV